MLCCFDDNVVECVDIVLMLQQPVVLWLEGGNIPTGKPGNVGVD